MTLQFIQARHCSDSKIAGYIDHQGFIVGILEIRKDRLPNLVFDDTEKIAEAVKAHQAKAPSPKHYSYKPISVMPTE